MDLSAYELQRLANIAENARLLLSLGLDPPEPSTPKLKAKVVRDAKSDPVKTRFLPKRGRDSPSGSSSSSYEASDFSDDDVDVLPFKRTPSAKVYKRGRTQHADGSVVTDPKASAKAYYKGARLYDPINGTSCHQCRQKTLDAKVICTNILQSHMGTLYNCPIMMCFRCLPNRYGQNVFEQLEHAWECPKCLGTCNCSFCMKARGRAPTGIMIHKARDLGFTSVAEMLVNTNHAITQGKIRSPRARLAPASPVKRKILKHDLAAKRKKPRKNSSSFEILISLDTPDANNESSMAMVVDEEDYVVESIISAAILNGKLFFQVRWAGYTEADDTMEPYSTVHDLAALDEFELLNPMVPNDSGTSIDLKSALRHMKEGHEDV